MSEKTGNTHIHIYTYHRKVKVKIMTKKAFLPKTVRTAAIAASIATAIAATSAFSADWPAFHGSDRSNKSKESGLLKEWPKGGPKLLWTAKGLGEGYSGVTVAGGFVYTAGNRDKGSFVFAFDLGGKLVWEKRAGASVYEAKDAFARPYQGSRGTPVVDGGVVYYLSDAGFLSALDAKTGAEKWSVSLRERFNAEMPKFGYSESPLIIGDRLYVAPYGAKATVVCLDKKTGSVIWESGRVGGDAGYASFVPAENSGYKQLISFTSEFVYGVSEADGKILWTAPFKSKYEVNCTDIAYQDGHVFAASGGLGSALVKLSAKGGGVAAEMVYETKAMDNQHGGVIIHNGYVYGSGHDQGPGWFCLDFKTGKQMWNAPGKGSVTFADGMLYFYDEKGKMSLVRAQSDKFAEAGSFEVPSGGKGANWAHPVVSGGVLYLRHADNLYAYNIK
jgi:outer membrane protein assembly factor BamB